LPWLLPSFSPSVSHTRTEDFTHAHAQREGKRQRERKSEREILAFTSREKILVISHYNRLNVLPEHRPDMLRDRVRMMMTNDEENDRQKMTSCAAPHLLRG